ncbi:MAG: hypothetical protein AAFP77_19685 [Bacteroidota bacterium]
MIRFSKLVTVLVFMLVSNIVNAQADTIFVIGAEFGSTTIVNDSTFQLTINHPVDQLGNGYLPTQIQEGYLVFDIQGLLFQIDSIVSANFVQSSLQVVEMQDNNVGPSGMGIIYRKPDNSNCIPRIPEGNTGISPAVVAKIHNHNVVNGCGGTGGGSGNTNLTYAASAADGTVASDTGTDATIPAGSTTNASLMLPGDKTKLDAIEAGATADQNTSEVLLSSAIADLPASTNAHEALTELSVNVTAVDVIAGALVTQSGMPVGSTDLGTFSEDIISDNPTTKSALQELETAVSVNQDSITALRADIGLGGGSTEVGDGATILGDGSGGDPFTVNSDLVNKRIGEYQADSSGTFFSTEKVLNGTGTGAYVINTGISFTASANAELVFDMHRQDNATSNRVSSTLVVLFRYTHNNTTLQRGTAFLDGRVPWLTNQVQIGIFNGTLHVIIGDEAETLDAIFRLKHAYFSGNTSYTFDYSALDIDRETDLAGAGFTGLENVTYENTGVIPGATIQRSTATYYASMIHSNNTNSSAAGADDVGVYEYYIPANNTSFSEGDFTNTVGIRVGGEYKAYTGAGYQYTIGKDADTYLRITEDGEYLFNEGTTARAPLARYEFGGSDAAILLTPHDQTLSFTKGLFWVDDSESRPKFHDGTTTQDLAFLSDISGGGTMSSFNVESDDFSSINIADGETLSILGGSNGIDTRDGVGREIVIDLDFGELPGLATAVGTEDIVIFDNVAAENSRISISAVGDYISTNFSDGNGVYSGSGTVPDFTSTLTSDNAGLTFADDNISLRGDVFLPDITEEAPHTYLGLTNTNKVVEFSPLDTLVIPVYCHPHDESLTTGSADYRGWRVPSHLNGARLVGVQYSFDTAGTGSVLIQLSNGTINIGGLSVTGSNGESTLNRTLVTGEKWYPNITTTGTSYEGLMLNLIIEK